MTCVLLVDSDLSAGGAIRSVLEMEGFEVVLADSAPSAIKAIETSAFDAVVIDVRKPGDEGLDTIKATHEIAPTLPIIAIASRKNQNSLGPEKDFLSFATEAGAAAGLYKPFTPRDLVTAVATCIDNRGGAPRPN